MTDELWLAAWVAKCGYLAPKLLDGERYAAVSPMVFTSAIIVGRVGDEWQYDDRWCYHSPEAAMFALGAWDGSGEPLGWHRHPKSGRRVAPDGSVYVAY